MSCVFQVSEDERQKLLQKHQENVDKTEATLAKEQEKSREALHVSYILNFSMIFMLE